MDFNVIVKIIYSAATIQGTFLGLLLFRSKTNQPANRILSVLLFLLSFHLILVGSDERDFFMTFPHLSRISWIIGTLYWPLLFLFIQKTTRIEVSPWMNVVLFLPFIFFLMVMLPYYLQSAEQKRMILDDFAKASQADFGWVNQTISVLHVIFQGLALAFYFFIERQLKKEYSGDEIIRIHWLKGFLMGVFAVTLIAVLSFFARNFNLPVISNLYNFHFIGLVILFYWLSYNALTYPAVFGLQAIGPTVEKKVAESEIKLKIVFESVRKVIETEKLYLIPTLTLTELAERAGVHRNLASEAINTYSGGNFFEFVNEYRIKEFKRLICDPATKNLSILGIAQESGFNSKATFYSIFKKKTGMTPSEFIESRSGLVN